MSETNILHISDLHVASDADRSLIDDIAKAMHSKRPQVIVISGDFVNGPDETKLVAVRDRLGQLAREFGDKDNPCLQVVVPGNHDCRRSGIFKSSPSAVFEKVFGKDWRRPAFFPATPRGVAFFCFDSNTNDPRVNFARGKVGREEFRRFENDYLAMAKEHGQRFAEACKIAVLHHHPLPIADSELSVLAAGDVIGKFKRYFTGDAFLGLEDAGVFLRQMVTKRIDLILHGHKHHPFYARVEVDAADEKMGKTRILAAGSASKATERGGYQNSFNFITLHEDGTLDAERWDNRSGTFYPQEPFSLISYEERRRGAFEEFCAERGYVVKHEAHNTAINRYGDCDREVLRLEMTSLVGKPLEAIPVETSSEAAIYAGLVLKSLNPQEADPQFVFSADRKRGEIRGEVRFGRPIDSRPVSFRTTYTAYNSYAFTKEQRFRMRGKDIPEYKSVQIRYPIEHLCLSIRFPQELPMPKPSVRVFLLNVASSAARDHREERWCEQSLRVCELLRTATLEVAQPLQDRRYVLEWNLTSERDLPGKAHFSAEEEGTARFLSQKLGALDPAEANNLAQEPLARAHEKIVARYSSTDSEECLELGLMAFDEAANALRFVAGVIRPAFHHYTLRDGQGVGGRAHKLNQNILIARKRLKDEEDFTAAPPPGVAASEFLLCLPLHYPLGRADGWVVGVLCLASNSAASKLLRLYSRTNEIPSDREAEKKMFRAQEDLRKLVQMLTEECFFAIAAGFGIETASLTLNDDGTRIDYSL